MHAARPLDRNHKPLEARQKVEGQTDTENRKDDDHHNWLGAKPCPCEVDQNRKQVADNKDRQISRAIVCAVVVKRLLADITLVRDLEITVKKMPFAAIRATAAKASHDCWLGGAVVDDLFRHLGTPKTIHTDMRGFLPVEKGKDARLRPDAARRGEKTCEEFDGKVFEMR